MATKKFLDPIGISKLWLKVMLEFSNIDHKHDDLYLSLGGGTVNGDITANKFVTSGATADGVVLGDGSVLGVDALEVNATDKLPQRSLWRNIFGGTADVNGDILTQTGLRIDDNTGYIGFGTDAEQDIVLGWGTNPETESSSLKLGDTSFKYKDSDVYHTGNFTYNGINSTIYVPTTAGDIDDILVSVGTKAPAWNKPADVSVGAVLTTVGSDVTGTTQATDDSSTKIATTEFVHSAVATGIATLTNALIYKGTIGTGGNVEALPAEYSVGDTYKVITAGTYSGYVCEVGDMIVAIEDGWTVVQNNTDIATSSATGVVKGGTTVESEKVYGINISGAGEMTVDVPWDDTTSLVKDEIMELIESLLPSKKYLTFEVLEDGTFSFKNTGTPDGFVSYSLDNGTSWSTLSVGDSTPMVSAGSKVIWKGNYKGTSFENYGGFSSTGKFNVSGNVMSLAYEDDFGDKVDLTGTDHIFCGLFKECSKLIDASGLVLPATILALGSYNSMFHSCSSLTAAPELPATTLARYCYQYMFQGCTSLTAAPELPATTLIYNCYNSMFYGCSSLTTTQTLPATTLANGCYNSMFHDCTSLTTAPELPATTIADWCYNQMFQGCTSLTTAPDLPASTLADNCYNSMFQGCTSLTTAPDLPASTLADNCYNSMFQGCTSLTTAPELPASTLADNCYNSMFYGCSSLIAAPVLPATTLASSCYINMFSGCSSLIAAPALPATTLADNCYQYMFFKCSSLTTAPALPATTLANNCYQYMFHSCSSLTTAPELPATELADNCYQYMFYKCSNLNYIKALFTTDPRTGSYTTGWVFGVSSTGEFVKNSAATWWVTGASGMPTGWNIKYYPDEIGSGGVHSSQYLTFEALEDGTFSFSKGDLSYSLDDGTTWSALSAGSSTPIITTGSKVLWKGNYKGTSSKNYGGFSSTGKFNVSGNIMSLAYGDNFGDIYTLTGSNFCFHKAFYGCSNLIDASNLALPATVLSHNCYNSMFYGCTSLTTAPVLPATTLANGCYNSMFHDCTSLTTAPVLPATTIADWCYNQMFHSCSSLTAAPELPATTLADNCYNSMFYGCTSLTTAPEIFPATELTSGCYNSMFSGCSRLINTPSLPATTLADNCYQYMFFGCNSLKTAPELPATVLAHNCYQYMFHSCNSLKTAPELPATELADNCYMAMFIGCSSLTAAPELPATVLAHNCYQYMFRNCTSLTTAPELPATTLRDDCYYGMFQGCTSLTTVPVLPATVLAHNCYLYMFYECSNLNYIKALFTTTPGLSYTANWVGGVSSTGTFVKNADATWNVTGTSGIPTGWTVETATA